MKAAILTGKRGIRVEERPRPVPGRGEVLVKVTLASLCGTDADFYAESLVAPRPSGHEFTGKVVETGPGVTRFPVGTRVVASWGVGCGQCPYCASGRPNLCDQVILFEGTHAEYFLVPHADRALSALPDAIADKAAIVMACSLSTGSYGVQVSAIRSTETVAVLGLGAVGLSMVLAAAAGKAGRIIGMDSIVYRRDTALALGAHEVGDPTNRDWLRSRDAAADIVLIATANPHAVETAVSLCRKGGRITVIGSQQTAPLPFGRFDCYGLHLFGTWSMIGGAYMDTVVHDVASGRIGARKLEGLVTHVFPLDQVQRAYELFDSHGERAIKIAVQP
jgi:threonine dehydrogenase-like Zn-dependent dehydrogenase